MKKFLFLILFPALAWASGPKYSYPTPRGLNDEMANIYNDIKNVSVVSNNVTGTTTNDNAPTGKIGETIESVAAQTALPTSTQWGDLTSISLTAGDWVISINYRFNTNGATVSQWDFGISNTTGNSFPDENDGDNAFSNTWVPTGRVSANVVNYQVKLSGSAPYYFKYRATYTGSPFASGRITAIRIR